MYGFTRIERFEPKKCPFCSSKNTKKNGKKRHKQNYLCKDCKRQFIGGSRMKNVQLWHAYTHGKQTYAQLVDKHHCSIKTIQRRLDSVQLEYATTTIEKAYVVMDTTYFGRRFGLMVFMDNVTRTILHYDIVRYETNALYRQGIQTIKEKDIIIQSITCDGRRGLIGSFDIPTQMCQFHQQQIITRYLTRKPKYPASQSLRYIALQLTKTNKAHFAKQLDAWYLQYSDYLNERSMNTETGKTWYTHKRLRSAYRSLRNNVKWLFVYQTNNHHYIANTTNALEALFSELKRQLNCHKGLNNQRKLRFINNFLCKRMSQ